MGLPQVGGDESDTERRQQAALEKQIRDLEKLREQEEQEWQAKVAARDAELEQLSSSLRSITKESPIEERSGGKSSETAKPNKNAKENGDVIAKMAQPDQGSPGGRASKVDFDVAALVLDHSSGSVSDSS